MKKLTKSAYRRPILLASGDESIAPNTAPAYPICQPDTAVKGMMGDGGHTWNTETTFDENAVTLAAEACCKSKSFKYAGKVTTPPIKPRYLG
jgi:hypothetical protein